MLFERESAQGIVHPEIVPHDSFALQTGQL